MNFFLPLHEFRLSLSLSICFSLTLCVSLSFSLSPSLLFLCTCHSSPSLVSVSILLTLFFQTLLPSFHIFHFLILYLRTEQCIGLPCSSKNWIDLLLYHNLTFRVNTVASMDNSQCGPFLMVGSSIRPCTFNKQAWAGEENLLESHWPENQFV